SAVFRPASTAARLITGRTPGSPRHTSQTCVLGGSLSSAIEQPQNILDRVFGWTCTSMPITTSQPLGNVRNLGVDLARLLIRTRDAEHQVLAPLRTQDLQPDRQPLGRAARN